MGRLTRIARGWTERNRKVGCRVRDADQPVALWIKAGQFDGTWQEGSWWCWTLAVGPSIWQEVMMEKGICFAANHVRSTAEQWSSVPPKCVGIECTIKRRSDFLWPNLDITKCQFVWRTSQKHGDSPPINNQPPFSTISRIKPSRSKGWTSVHVDEGAHS